MSSSSTSKSEALLASSQQGITHGKFAVVIDSSERVEITNGDLFRSSVMHVVSSKAPI